MRKRKFRAWSKGRMYYNVNLSESPPNFEPEVSTWDINDNGVLSYKVLEDAIAMENTMKLDSNGLHVYEGDIVSTEDGKWRGVVDYSPLHAAFVVNHRGYPAAKMLHELNSWMIIGNIYNSPHMLNVPENS